MSNSPVPMFIQTIKTWAYQITNATGTTIETLVTAGVNGSKVEAVNISNTDTVAHTLSLYINDGTTNHLFATISIPASAGNATGTPPVNVLASANMSSLPYDANGNKFLYLKAGYALNIAITAAATTGTLIDAVATGGDF